MLVLRPYCPGAGHRIHKNDDLPGPFHLLDMSGEWVLPEDRREQSGISPVTHANVDKHSLTDSQHAVIGGAGLTERMTIKIHGSSELVSASL